MRAVITPEMQWRAMLAMGTLAAFADPCVWGNGRVRWRRAYAAVRAQCHCGNSLYQWATKHNPFLNRL